MPLGVRAPRSWRAGPTHWLAHQGVTIRGRAAIPEPMLVAASYRGSGPLYKSHKVEGNSIRVSFDHVGKGMIVGKKNGLAPTEVDREGKLGRFAIAGADKEWHWAEATIDGNTVVVKSSEVEVPVAVRYAYSMNPTGANLYNQVGIPASPFRTDEW